MKANRHKRFSINLWRGRQEFLAAVKDWDDAHPGFAERLFAGHPEIWRAYRRDGMVSLHKWRIFPSDFAEEPFGDTESAEWVRAEKERAISEGKLDKAGLFRDAERVVLGESCRVTRAEIEETMAAIRNAISHAAASKV